MTIIEVHEITLLVKVDRSREDRPDKWDWTSLVGNWTVPKTEARLVSSFANEDEFYEALDEGRI